MNLYHYLAIEPDVAGADLARFWFGAGKTSIFTMVGGNLLDLYLFDYDAQDKKVAPVRKAYSNENDTALMQFWASEGNVGNRHFNLFRAFRFYIDQGVKQEDIANKLKSLNKMFPEPHADADVEAKIEAFFKQIHA